MTSHNSLLATQAKNIRSGRVERDASEEEKRVRR